MHQHETRRQYDTGVRTGKVRADQCSAAVDQSAGQVIGYDNSNPRHASQHGKVILISFWVRTFPFANTRKAGFTN